MTVRTQSDFPDAEAGSGVGVKSSRGGGEVPASTSIESIRQSIRTDAFAPGEIIAGKYIVERVVGIGGVGVVLAAKHAELDEMVAIKFLHPQMQTRADVVGRFANEARMAVRIKSEHAARVFDFGVEPERGPYLVMEYLEGRTLAEAIQSAPIRLVQAVEYVLQICEAMAVAHSLGIVHRDIKPENLFLSRRHDGTEAIKVLDFGISKPSLTGNALGLVRSMVETQDIMGTPLYMSPEQIRSTATVDHRTDLWSIGIVLYEMLARRMPFAGDTIPSICANVLETEAAPLSSFLPVPPAFDLVVAGCLQKDRAKRFQSVADLTAALMPFAAGRGSSFPPHVATLLEIAIAPPAAAPSAPPAPPAQPGLGVLGAASETLTRPGSLPPVADEPHAPDEKRRARRSLIVGLAAIVVGAVIAAVLVATSPRPIASAAAPAEPTARASAAAPPSPVEVPAPTLPPPTASARVTLSPPARGARAAPAAPITPAAPVALARGGGAQGAAPTPAAASPGVTTRATAPRSMPSAAPAPAPSAAPAETCVPPFYFEGTRKVFKPECL